MPKTLFPPLLAIIPALLLPLEYRPLQAGSLPDTLQLKLVRHVILESDGALNLSGMAASEDGWLYFCDDNGPAPPDWQPENPIILRVRLDSVLDPAAKAPRLELVEPAGGRAAFAALAGETGKAFKYDLEGIEVAAPGRLWLVDERDRLLLELDLASGKLSCLAGPEVLLQGRKDLAAGRINYALEGVARVGNRLFIAHEMLPNLILSYNIAANFSAGRVIDIPDSYDFCDLDRDRGSLYALARTRSLVYKIDPDEGKLLAVAEFRLTADNPAYRYRNREDFYRNSEGLVVKGRNIFIVLDGNFQTRLEDSNQRAPLLLIFDRPAGF
ncbi:MAG: hypothetical protein A3F83_07290 [Candidatus Glassbacteria bacterium RIFCSPLOWO2_12_FULL_58_11]|uniref:Phytase-like domain-containing protein n=1 Tax=Candidatus Glassbacteria bacterium RIFCSPLOWO2_12_FULL_58_11 TaxID=1817867 RepID=A0A1F5YJS6_9BACT|nr:MAG: hypothetical protein A3F83_07290 [Candidatus Glassbacteria bacterium RIFCSPLOWO2_12_FULL_58_11]